MIKNATFYKLAEPLAIVYNDLAQMRFSPTAPTQEKSLGWVEPSGPDYEGSLLTSKNSGATICKLLVETRKVPSATLAAEVDAQCKQIEHATGRKPGKKERRDLKEQALTTLLPHAFPCQKSALCIIDGNTLIVDSTSAGLLDDVLTALVRCVDGFVAWKLETCLAPATAMAEWLHSQAAPGDLDIGKSCELLAMDETAAKVRFTNHPLLTQEVLDHLQQGKLPISLELSFDDRVQFVLTDALQLKKIDFGSEVMQQANARGVDSRDFDGSLAIAIGELRPLIAELVSALGGEVGAV